MGGLLKLSSAILIFCPEENEAMLTTLTIKGLLFAVPVEYPKQTGPSLLPLAADSPDK